MIKPQDELVAKEMLSKYYALVDSRVRKLESETDNLSHMILGLVSELSEIDEALVDPDGIDWINIMEEVGDLIFYIVGWSIFRGFKLEIQLTHRTYTTRNILRLTGKLANLLKRQIAYDKSIPSEEEQEFSQKILTALLNYYEMGTHINSIAAMDRVYAKLTKRYENGFTVEAALNRDLEAERKALEGK